MDADDEEDNASSSSTFSVTVSLRRQLIDRCLLRAESVVKGEWLAVDLFSSSSCEGRDKGASTSIYTTTLVLYMSTCLPTCLTYQLTTYLTN